MAKKVCSNILKCENERSKVLSIDEFSIIECIQCNHHYTPPTTNLSNHIRKVYKDDYFFGGGVGYPDYLKNKDVLINHGRKYAKIIKKYKNPGHILDIGAACGFILKGFELEGWTGTGIDLSRLGSGRFRRTYTDRTAQLTICVFLAGKDPG